MCEPLKATEVQGISFVGSTSEVFHPQPQCNLQNLCPVPPYDSSFPKTKLVPFFYYNNIIMGAYLKFRYAYPGI